MAQVPRRYHENVRNVLDNVCGMWLDNDMTNTNYIEASADHAAKVIRHLIARCIEQGIPEQHIPAAVQAAFAELAGV